MDIFYQSLGSLVADDLKFLFQSYPEADEEVATELNEQKELFDPSFKVEKTPNPNPLSPCSGSNNDDDDEDNKDAVNFASMSRPAPPHRLLTPKTKAKTTTTSTMDFEPPMIDPSLFEELFTKTQAYTTRVKARVTFKIKSRIKVWDCKRRNKLSEKKKEDVVLSWWYIAYRDMKVKEKGLEKNPEIDPRSKTKYFEAKAAARRKEEAKEREKLKNNKKRREAAEAEKERKTDFDEEVDRFFFSVTSREHAGSFYGEEEKEEREEMVADGVNGSHSVERINPKKLGTSKGEKMLELDTKGFKFLSDIIDRERKMSSEKKLEAEKRGREEGLRGRLKKIKLRGGALKEMSAGAKTTKKLERKRVVGNEHGFISSEMWKEMKWDPTPNAVMPKQELRAKKRKGLDVVKRYDQYRRTNPAFFPSDEEKARMIEEGEKVVLWPRDKGRKYDKGRRDKRDAKATMIKMILAERELDKVLKRFEDKDKDKGGGGGGVEKKEEVTGKENVEGDTGAGDSGNVQQSQATVNFVDAFAESTPRKRMLNYDTSVTAKLRETHRPTRNLMHPASVKGLHLLQKQLRYKPMSFKGDYDLTKTPDVRKQVLKRVTSIWKVPDKL